MSGSTSSSLQLSTSDALSSACFFPSWPELVLKPQVSASGALVGGVDANGVSTAGQVRLGVDAVVPFPKIAAFTRWTSSACGGVAIAASSKGYGGTNGAVGILGETLIAVEDGNRQDRVRVSALADQSQLKLSGFYVVGQPQSTDSSTGMYPPSSSPGHEMFFGLVATLRSTSISFVS